MSNSSSVGVPQQSSGSSTWLTLGTPEANPLISYHYNVPFSMSFTLSQLETYGDITAICDRYKLSKVDVKFLYSANAISGTGAASAGPSMLPIVNYIVDHDDAAVQTCTKIREKMGLKTKTCGPGKFVKTSLRPVPVVVSGSAGGQYIVPKQVYMNSDYPSNPHYGLKGYFENWDLQTLASATSAWSIEITYHVSCRDLQ